MAPAPYYNSKHRSNTSEPFKLLNPPGLTFGKTVKPKRIIVVESTQPSGNENQPSTKYKPSAVTPIHRESLAVNQSLVTQPPQSTPRPQYARSDQVVKSEHKSHRRDKSDVRGQSDWMTSYFPQPIKGDTATCCLSWFLPCVLHGKTYWRLKKISLGEDPFDWKTSDGCNKMCLVHGVLLSCCCISVALTAIQRARIRAKYRIRGRLVYDILSSIFCHPCTLTQGDREVRAREGAVHLAKRPEMYDHPEMTQLQPRPQQPMRYASPRTADEDIEVRENRIFKQDRPRKLQKRFARIEEMREVPAEPIDSSSTEEANPSRKNIQAQGLASDTQIRAAETDGPASAPYKNGRLSGRNDLSSLANGSPTSTIQARQHDSERPGSKQELSYYHDFSDSPVTKAVLDYYEEEERHYQQYGVGRRLVRSTNDTNGPLRHDQHVLSDCAVETSRASSTSSTIRPSHAATCESAASAPSTPINEHSLGNCTPQLIHSPAPKQSPRQHRISGCTVDSTGAGSLLDSQESDPFTTSSTADVQHGNLNYPMNSLEPSTSSVSARRLSHKQKLHSLKDCAPSTGSSTPIKSRQHRMESCTAPESVYTCDEHSLGHCELESGITTPAYVRHHRFASCSLIDTSGSSTPSPLKQHRITSCNVLSPSSRRSSAPRNNVLEDGCVLSGYNSPQRKQHGGSELASSTRQHSTTGCVESESEFKEDQQHLLDDCEYSTGSATPTRQHRVTSCVVSSPSSSSRDSLVKQQQHRFSSCPGNIPDEGSRENGGPNDVLVDISEDSQATKKPNHDDHLHTMDECFTPAQKAKFEATESTFAEDDKYSTGPSNAFDSFKSAQSTLRETKKKGNGKGKGKGKEKQPHLSDIASHESDAQSSLAQTLAENNGNATVRKKAMVDGTQSVSSRPSVGSVKYSKALGKGKEREEKDKKKRIEESSEGSRNAFASYFGFGGRKTEAD